MCNSDSRAPILLADSPICFAQSLCPHSAQRARVRCPSKQCLAFLVVRSCVVLSKLNEGEANAPPSSCKLTIRSRMMLADRRLRIDNSNVHWLGVPRIVKVCTRLSTPIKRFGSSTRGLKGFCFALMYPGEGTFKTRVSIGAANVLRTWC